MISSLPSHFYHLWYSSSVLPADDRRHQLSWRHSWQIKCHLVHREYYRKCQMHYCCLAGGKGRFARCVIVGTASVETGLNCQARVCWQLALHRPCTCVSGGAAWKELEGGQPVLRPELQMDPACPQILRAYVTKPRCKQTFCRTETKLSVPPFCSRVCLLCI